MPRSVLLWVGPHLEDSRSVKHPGGMVAGFLHLQSVWICCCCGTWEAHS